jgi:hypothetical protein
MLGLGLTFIGFAQAYASNGPPAPYHYAEAIAGILGCLFFIFLLVQMLRHWGRGSGSAADGSGMAATGDGGYTSSIGYSAGGDCGFGGDGGGCGGGGDG